MMKAMSPRHSRPLPQDPTIHRGAAIVRQQLLKSAPDTPQRPSWAEVGELCDECTTEDDDVWVEYNDKPFRRNSIEVDPPSGDNWSVDAEDYSVSPDDPVEDLPPEPPITPTASPVKAAAPLPYPYHTDSASPRRPHTSVGGFISSEDEDDDIETNYSEDIVEVDEPMSHPFYEPVANGVVVLSASPKEPLPPPKSMSISSGSSSEDRPATALFPSKSSNDNAWRGPLHLEKNSTRNTFGRPSLFDYNIDVYCGYDVDTDDVEYPSPGKQPVTEIPVRSTPGTTVSNLSTPDGLSHRPTLSLQQISSALMLQYDQLLHDPAYLHAQNAGFVWQSLVGQHIRFPSTWWNGARGPPMGVPYGGDPDTIPWMYFGRHSVPRNAILNQLVKCRASAGRLLLHIIVQDLMTRTPIQDICIGCFHPNAKGVRPSGSPALKRLEESRDVWMAVRKRHPQAVAATDSLLYAPHHWSRGGGEAEQEYSISRSPLGPGRRVTNTNVRSVFGDKAPLETIFLSEDELYERLATHVMQQHSASKCETAPPKKMSPPMAILQEFVFA
jgi:hypothetical protein